MTRNAARFCSVVLPLAIGCGGDDSRAGHGRESGGVGPVAQGQGLRVFSGRAALLTEGGACTAELGGTRDRWCGFVAFAADDSRSLYVFNVSEVLAGVPVRCDAPDPNCLLLTSRVGSSAGNFHATGFGGDTLVYYDETVSPHVWRPGMTRGRLLMQRTEDADVIFCSAAPLGTAVGCLSIPRGQLSSVVLADIYAGAADGAREPLLQPFQTVIWANGADVGGANRFRWGFPGAGYVAWSSPETADGPEILMLSRVDDPASQVSVATNVHYWKTSADGSRWFWLRATDLRGNGMLQTAEFPDGIAIDLRADVSDYALASNGALVLLTATGELVSIAAPARAKEMQRVLDAGAKGLVSVSEAGHVAYAKNISGGKVADLFLAKLDGSARCTLDTSGKVPLNSFHFAPDAGAAVWALQRDDEYDAYHTRLDGCSTEPLASAVSMLSWVSSKTTMFVDEFENSRATGALRVRHVSKTGALEPSPPTLLAEHVGSFGVMGSVLLYAVDADTDADGVYVRAFAR